MTLGFVRNWLLSILAVGAAVTVATGTFETHATDSQHPFLFFAVILVAALIDTLRRVRGWTPPGFPKTIEAPLLWTVGAWMLLRLFPEYSTHTIIVPAALIAWLVGSTPPSIFLFPLFTALAMECGLTVSGQQELATLGLNLAVYGLAAGSLPLFALSTAFRQHLRRAIDRTQKEETNKEYAADMGLFAQRPILLDDTNQFNEQEYLAPFSQPTVETVSSSFDLHLEMLRQVLEASTVALLWPDKEGQEMRLRNIATVQEKIKPGPYPMGTGIIGALQKAQGEIAMAPAGRTYPGLPYYEKTEGIGGLLALEISTGKPVDETLGITPPSGVLCIDRQAESPWSEDERGFLKLAVRKISLELTMGRRLLNMDLERNTMQQLYLGLRELNGVLGLEASFNATIKTIKNLVHADFVAISLVEDKVHRVVRVEEMRDSHLDGLAFPIEEGLVGQVIKFDHSLPAKAEYRGPAPVFSNSHRLKGYSSLLIVPLRKEKGGTIGALTVAATQSGVFTRARQDILELIAGQIAIKIDLAQAHEKINKLATTDGLTGLANHRTFQHAFEVMLERAQRRKSLLCLILCDIDHFKGINDTFGHPFGDHVLQEVAATLGDSVRKVDLAARYGGEEFTMILEDSGIDGGMKLAERVRGLVESLGITLNGEAVKVTISMGLAAYPADGEDKNQLISNADQALYHAKRAGRNRVQAWSDMAPEKKLKELI